MRIAFALLALVHGLIHLMGFAKAFGFGEALPLRHEISRTWGGIWLVAALLWVSVAVLLFANARGWWVIGLVALLCSQAAIVSSFADAKWGTAANVLLAIPVVFALANLRATSFQSIYAAEQNERLRAHVTSAPVTEADLARLPAPVQRYLRRAGVVGRPRVSNFRARLRGELRSSLDAPWMPITVEQTNFFEDPARLFLVQGERFGVPFEALHLYRGRAATMQVALASVFQVVDARGPQMNQSETVTVFNDMCLFAPAALLAAPIQWEGIDDHSVRAHFTNAGNTVAALLTFSSNGDLVNFESRDRFQSADGKSYTLYPWYTPIRSYGEFHGQRVVSRAEASWRMPRGDFAYARLELLDIQYNVPAAD